eukprot:9285653-Lingulodinium_polyedra.AAC.1
MEVEVSITKDIAGELCDRWNNKLKTQEAMKYRDRMLYAIPERSEKDKPRYALMGKLRRLVEPAAKASAGAWAMDVVNYPVYKLIKVQDGVKKDLVQLGRDCKVKFTEEGAATLGKSQQELLEELEALP